MRQRLADYVADFLAGHGVTDVFSVVGGGAMHLNDALGHNEGLKVTYNHHEQACAIAAEAYARLENKIAAVCVTTGPGGTNALTGVVGGWLDSVQVKNKHTVLCEIFFYQLKYFFQIFRFQNIVHRIADTYNCLDISKQFQFPHILKKI